MATYIGTAGDDEYPDGADNTGDDTIHDGGGGNDTLNGGDGDDAITVTGGNDVADGDGGDDDLLIVDYSTLSGNFRSNSSFGLGNLTNDVGTSVTYAGFERFNITTGAGDDSIDLTIAGDREGDDVINAGTGTDSVNAGAGSDRLVVNYSSLFIASSVTTSFGGDLASGYSGFVNALFAGFGSAARVDFVGIESFDITGSGGADTLTTGDGDDRLDGGGGDDTLQGGGGDDVYFVNSLGDRVIEAAGGGDDQVFSNVNFNAQAMGAAVEDITLSGVARTAIGNTLDNTLIGNIANNILNGYKGADRMEGRQGNDVYIVDNIGDVVVEGGGLGTDRVNSAVDHTLAEHVENLTLLGGADLAGTGNDLLNRIVGNGGDNTIAGAGGVDLLSGGLGADTFVYTSVSDSTYGGYDRIYDLERGDLIDISAIDANENTLDVNEDFVLVDSFSRTAGEMTLDFNGDYTFLVGDTDGDGKGDFRIALLGGDYEDFRGILGSDAYDVIVL